jgi:hypothetical protein
VASHYTSFVKYKTESLCDDGSGTGGPPGYILRIGDLMTRLLKPIDGDGVGFITVERFDGHLGD